MRTTYRVPVDYSQLNEYYRDIEKYDRAHGCFAVIVLLAVVLPIVYWIAIGYPRAQQKRIQDYAAYKAQQAVKPVARPQQSFKDVEDALRSVGTNIRDITGDRKVNCQDYAAMFLWYYPNAQIMYNPKIGSTGHVFNRVWTPEGWLYIEPQNKGGIWLMREAWKQWEQVRQYNQEMTARFGRPVRR
jgi:hypothetical protein